MLPLEGVQPLAPLWGGCRMYPLEVRSPVGAVSLGYLLRPRLSAKLVSIIGRLGSARDGLRPAGGARILAIGLANSHGVGELLFSHCQNRAGNEIGRPAPLGAS